MTMKLTCAVIGLLLWMPVFAMAQAYGDYDPRKILVVTNTGAGEKYSLDLSYLDQIIGDLSAHAKNYPPQFDNDSDKQRAIQHATMLSAMLDTLVTSTNAAPELLRRSSQLNSIGHNLSIPGAAQKADRDFQNLLVQLPDEPALNYAYGVFLGNANQALKALPYLDKAASAGYSQAHFALGMAHLTQNNTTLALKHFETYYKHHPTDTAVTHIIDAIKNGSIQFKADSLSKS